MAAGIGVERSAIPGKTDRVPGCQTTCSALIDQVAPSNLISLCEPGLLRYEVRYRSA